MHLTIKSFRPPSLVIALLILSQVAFWLFGRNALKPGPDNEGSGPA
jgi:hypothetical protein